MDPASGHCNDSLHGPSHQAAIHHRTYCLWRILRQCPITFPHSTVTDRRRHRAALDNFCLTNINSPSSKFNAKLQLAVHEGGITILIPGESSRAVHHRPASSLEGRARAVDCHGAGLQVAPETHSRPSWDPIDYVLLFSYGTDGFHLDIPSGHRYRILLLATDAERRPGLDVLLCGDRLFQRYLRLSSPVQKWNSNG